eukprot:Skav219798  [mRNA]  locus=scaffold147:115277:117782:- [translate_table: standard]
MSAWIPDTLREVPSVLGPRTAPFVCDLAAFAAGDPGSSRPACRISSGPLMHPETAPDPLVESITVQLAGLELTITATPVASGGYSRGSGSEFELVGPGSPSTFLQPSSPELQALVLETTSPLALAALPIDLDERLLRALRSSHPEWSARARLARAYRAGLAAAIRLGGELSPVTSPAIPFRNSIYIVLRCEDYPNGFWTSSYRTYINAVGEGSGLQPRSISHALASRAELSLLGRCSATMASRTLRGPLTREAAQGALAAPASQRVLPEVFIDLNEEETGFAILACHLAYIRQNGFMLVIPGNDHAHAVVESLGISEEAAPLFHVGVARLETIRGRDAGLIDVELVDFPWDLAGQFTFARTGRHAVPRARTLGFTAVGETGQCRPQAASARELAAEWMTSMEESTAQEYLTGEEAGEDELLGDPEPELPAPSQEVVTLRAQIAELEQQLRAQQQVVAPRPSSASAVKTPALFQADGAPQMSQSDWARLQHLAGSPPPRVSSGEVRRKQLAYPTVAKDEAAFANLEREAEEDDLALMTLPETMASSDPIHQMMFLQMQQNAALLKKLISRGADPVLGALTGGSGLDSGSGSSSGVKGCLARDAYIKASQDLDAVQTVTRQNMLKELGLAAHREEGGTMRKYIERKVPLAEYRLLPASSPDKGRTQTAWLLTGWQEPPYHILLSSKKKGSLQQFCKLCKPAWLTANLAYLRDLDFVEARMAAVGKPRQPALDDPENPSKPPPKKKTPKGKGKGKNPQAAASEQSSTTEV